MTPNNDKRKKIVIALVLATIVVILTYIFNNYVFKQEPIAKNGFYFNTIIAIQLNDTTDESLIDDCFQMANTYEHYFSRTLEDSDIYKINHADGSPVEVHEETAELIRYGIAFGELSDGVFDISIGALTDLWDIPNNDGTIPAQADIDAALATVDYRQIVVDGNTVTLKNPDAALDLGGIAKGYVADRMREYLNAHGSDKGFINLGGNVLTLGQKANDEPYHIGIRKPFGEDGETITAVDVTDRSIVTSGRYERYFEKDGRIYHHILDSKTGYPYDNGLNGVTILSDSSMVGDALSTICFALGQEKGTEFLSSMPSNDFLQSTLATETTIQAIFIDENNEMTTVDASNQ